MEKSKSFQRISSFFIKKKVETPPVQTSWYGDITVDPHEPTGNDSNSNSNSGHTPNSKFLSAASFRRGKSSQAKLSDYEPSNPTEQEFREFEMAMKYNGGSFMKKKRSSQVPNVYGSVGEEIVAAHINQRSMSRQESKSKLASRASFKFGRASTAPREPVTVRSKINLFESTTSTPGAPDTGSSTPNISLRAKSLSKANNKSFILSPEKSIYNHLPPEDETRELQPSMRGYTKISILCPMCKVVCPQGGVDKDGKPVVHALCLEIYNRTYHKSCLKCMKCDQKITFTARRIVRNRFLEQKIFSNPGEEFMITRNGIFHVYCSRPDLLEFEMAPESIRCQRCMKAYTDTSYTLADEQVCKKCFQETQLAKCIVCLKQVDIEVAIFACGRYFHPEHFVCRKCHKVIPEGEPFFEHRGGAFCEDCFPEVLAGKDVPKFKFESENKKKKEKKMVASSSQASSSASAHGGKEDSNISNLSMVTPVSTSVRQKPLDEDFEDPEYLRKKREQLEKKIKERKLKEAKEQDELPKNLGEQAMLQVQQAQAEV